MESEIRVATQKDFEEIKTLFLELCEVENTMFDKTVSQKFPSSQEGVAYLNKRISGGSCWLAVVDGKTVGYLVGSIEKPEIYRQTGLIGVLESAFVKEGLRNEGIGSGLFGKFKEWCALHNAERIRVEASFRNKPAIEFYRELGFEDYSLLLEMEL